MSFEARTERQAGATIVSFRGDLDIASEADEAASLEAALDGADVLLADLRERDFLDSMGVHVLLSADLRAREHGVCFGVALGDGMIPACSRSLASTSDSPSSDDPVELTRSEPPLSDKD